MENQISNWKGFKIQGNIAELDKIIENSGVISLDLDDIINTLSSSGENYITVANGNNIPEAFKTAVDGLPVNISKIEKLLIQFCVGEKQPDMSELSSISTTLSNGNKDLQVIWGISQIENLGDNVKVVLLSSLSR